MGTKLVSTDLVSISQKHVAGRSALKTAKNLNASPRMAYAVA